MFGNSLSFSLKPSFWKSQFVKKKYDIDSDISQLSTKKLWRVIYLSEVPGCELDEHFIRDVKMELIVRKDFDKGRPWGEPH